MRRDFSLLSLPLCLSLACLCLNACTKSGGGDDDGSSRPQTGDSGIAGEFRTNCGTPLGGTLQNPVNAGQGIRVSLQSSGTDGTVLILREGGSQLLKLRALSESPSSLTATRAKTVVNSFPRSVLLFTDDCDVNTQTGAQGIVGDLFSESGESLVETLIEGRAAEIDARGGCGEDLVAGCYQSLLDASQPVTGATISNFLWKPQADRDGKLVVLLNPGGATVVVNGQTLASSGPSNGRGTTARGNKPGGAYGANVRVEAFDSLGRALVFPSGETTLIIPNGSVRVEIP